MAVIVSPQERDYWAQHPIEWCETFLGCRLWSKQKEILEAIRDYDAVTVRSGHGVGKSYILAAAMLWFGFTHPGSKVISTAPTFDQVRFVLWVEVAKLHAKLKENLDPCGHLTQTALMIDSDRGWFLRGRSTDEPQGLVGTHERNLLVVFDEACGISRDIFEAAEGLITARGNKQVLIGNPVEPSTYFHETHTGEVPGFHKIRINVLDNPNIKKTLVNGKVKYIDNLDENGELPFPDLTSLAWVNKMRDSHGEKSATWSAKVLGEFPTIASDALMDGRWVAAAVQKGLLLRKTIDRLEEGSEILDGQVIRQLMGRSHSR